MSGVQGRSAQVSDSPLTDAGCFCGARARVVRGVHRGCLCGLGGRRLLQGRGPQVGPDALALLQQIRAPPLRDRFDQGKAAAVLRVVGRGRRPGRLAALVDHGDAHAAGTGPAYGHAVRALPGMPHGVGGEFGDDQLSLLHDIGQPECRQGLSYEAPRHGHRCRFAGKGLVRAAGPRPVVRGHVRRRPACSVRREAGRMFVSLQCGALGAVRLFHREAPKRPTCIGDYCEYTETYDGRCSPRSHDLVYRV